MQITNNTSPFKIFVSYSRADTQFADELVAGLELAGFDVTIDRHSIIEGEDWKARLGALIASADTIVFVLSPDSATSPICQWEVEKAVSLSKRIMPVLVRKLGDTPAPKKLAAINFVRFDSLDDGTPRPMLASLQSLTKALNTNVEWLREHTRLLARALEWEAESRSNTRLLQGEDIGTARSWASTRPKDSPEVTDLHLVFIRASETAEADRQNEERQRLEAIARTQAAHASELSIRENQVRKYSRRSAIFLGCSAAAATVAAVAAQQAFRWSNEYKETQAQRFRDANRQDISGQLIAYATSPGATAYDGSGDHSPYSGSLLKTIKQRDLSVTEAILMAHHALAQNKETPQIPFFSSSLTGEIFLHRKPKDRKISFLSIGNCNYELMPPLKNPINDARAIGKYLDPLCDQVSIVSDCPRKLFTEKFRGAIRYAQDQSSFRVAGIAPPLNLKSLNRNNLFILYFGGMGLMIDREVYLGLTDSSIPDFEKMKSGNPATEMRRAGWVQLSEIRGQIKNQFAASTIFLDMCLDDPRHTGSADR